MQQPPVRELLALVGLGGVLGSLTRWGAVELLGSLPATLAVNLLGSLLLGALVGARPHAVRLRAFAGTGVLGGLTTMSGLAAGAVREPLLPAGAYVVGTVAGGLLLAALGLRLGRGAAG